MLSSRAGMSTFVYLACPCGCPRDAFQSESWSPVRRCHALETTRARVRTLHNRVEQADLGGGEDPVLQGWVRDAC